MKFKIFSLGLLMLMSIGMSNALAQPVNASLSQAEISLQRAQDHYQAG
jgi:hypothetical protein